MIRVSDLNFRYGKKPVLNAINLAIAPSTIVSLVGPNGSGKSTLLKCLCRILKSDESAIEIDGKPLQKYSPKEAGADDRLCAAATGAELGDFCD